MDSNMRSYLLVNKTCRGIFLKSFIPLNLVKELLEKAVNSYESGLLTTNNYVTGISKNHLIKYLRSATSKTIFVKELILDSRKKL